MKQSCAAWARAYAIQAKADLDARSALLGAEDVPVCQQLHFLQMAAEKVAKAHRCWGGTPPEELQSSHAYAARVIPIIAKQRFKGDVSQAHVLQTIRDLAREIELLAPAVDAGGKRPDNCEYPWEDDAGRLCIPAELPFKGLCGIARHDAGKKFLKILITACDELARGSFAPTR